jgi:poly-beta-1,6-N-acetyl-D-glucosamine synthase
MNHDSTKADDVTSAPQTSSLRYALITPARNEAENIERLVQSMVAQTVRPVRWVIVSDGSTDGTDDIVRKHAAEHGWIELERRPERAERHFAAKVEAFNAGYARLKNVEFDLVGNMDADISFDADLFAFLTARFAENPKLGLGGAPFREGEVKYDYRFASVDHVSGALQLFRRECFEQIGGYVPIKGGGIDTIAVWSARARGWQTRTFTEKFYRHHRVMGTAKHSVWRVKFKDGNKDYALGVHPLWELFRACFQMTKPPVIVGGLLLGMGYYWSVLSRKHRTMPPELVRFRREDQMQRLRALFMKPFTSRAAGGGAGEVPAASRNAGR